jgi:hypothetical protein
VKDKLVYIAGPMSGLPSCNREAFFDAEGRIRKAGFNKIINPARIPADGKSPEKYKKLVELGVYHAKISDIVVLLPGWINSNGARQESNAAFNAGKTVSELERFLNSKKESENAN